MGCSYGLRTLNLQPGDVIGTYLDFDSKQFKVTYNGGELHTTSVTGPDPFVGHGFYPFVSGKQVKLKFNVGGVAFIHCPDKVPSLISASVRPRALLDQMVGSSTFQVKNELNLLSILLTIPYDFEGTQRIAPAR